jgi:hypothetical protein
MVFYVRSTFICLRCSFTLLLVSYKSVVGEFEIRIINGLFS